MDTKVVIVPSKDWSVSRGGSEQLYVEVAKEETRFDSNIQKCRRSSAEGIAGNNRSGLGIVRVECGHCRGASVWCEHDR